MEAFRPKGDLPAASLHRALPPGAHTQGAWQDLPDGRRVWRAAIRAAGAQALRVHFTNFDVGHGRVWLHDGSGDENSIAGPYSGRGAYGDGEFWSDLVFGEAAIIEFEPEDAAPGAPPFELSEISHVFRGLEPQASIERQAALGCHEDLGCHPEYADISKSVARMVFETGEGGAYCTGALVMDRGRTFTPYFLTANHCISTESEARSLITFWMYQTSGCNQAAPDPRSVPRATGARYLAGGEVERGDYTLLQLNEVPSGVTFAGWRPDEVPIGTKVFGIHHPAGDYKRVSIGERAQDRATSFSVDKHYVVPWRTGLTEGGSSGSPLFSDEGVIIGQLTGGPKPPAGKTGCDLMPSYSLYGKFAVAFPAFQRYLDGRDVTPPASGGGASLTSGTARDWSYNVSSPTLFNGNYGFKIDVPSGATALNVMVTSTNPSAEILVVARNGVPPSVTDGRVQSDISVEMKNGRAVLRLDASSTPAIRPGTWHIALAVFTTGTVSGNITATVETGAGTPPPSGGGSPVALTPGVARNLVISPVSQPTLFNGGNGYKVDVPAGAARLEVRVGVPGGVDVAALVRYGSEPAFVDGKLQFDYMSAAQGTDQVVTVASSSTPPLKSGTYYIALAVFTTGREIRGTIVANVQTSGTTPPAGSNNLTSGVAQTFNLPAVAVNTLFYGDSGFRIAVPEGATRLEIKVVTSTPNADVDLFVRFGQDVQLSGSSAVADYKSESDGGNESVTITASSNPPLRAGTYYIALGLFTRGIPVTGTVTATVERGSTPSPGGPTALIAGVPRNVSLPSVTEATMFTGEFGYKITVPSGATKLEFRLASSINADVQMYARFGEMPGLSGGRAVADWSTTGSGANKSLTITPSSTPALRPGDYYVAFGLFTTRVAFSGTITATLETPAAPPPSETSGTLLTSGQSREISLDAVGSPRLFTGASGYRILVPEGAARLEIRTTASPASADVDLYVRYGAAPSLADGRVVSDFSSSGPAGQETVAISGAALKAGTYYIALGLFTTNTSVRVTLTATVRAGTGGGGSGPTVLTSGARQSFNIPAVSNNTLLSGSLGYQIAVPANARKLTIRLETVTAGVDLDLYARFGAAVEVSDGRVVADYDSSGSGGNEVIEITPATNPALRAGTYYIAIGVFTTGIAANGSLTATVETDDTAAAPVLQPGTPSSFRVGPVTGPTLLRSSGTFKVTVPAGATRLQVRATAATPGADIDLHVRFGTPPEVADGKVVDDYSSTSAGGDETVTVLATSTPPLRAGDYYVTLALHTAGVEVSGSITATLDTSAGRPSGSTLLTSGVPGKFSLPAVGEPTLFVGDYGFRVEVPEGATRLEIKLLTSTPNVDTDLYVRYGADVDLADGNVVADWDSSSDTGNETVVVTTTSSKPLAPGTYYIGMGLFTAGVAAEGKVTATIERTPSVPAPPGARTLEPNAETPFSFPAVSDNTLFSGDYAYKIEVPEGTTKFQVRISTATPGADVDLFVRQGAMPEVSDGRVVADYRSTSDSGDEMITVTPYTTPPLKPGVYYIAMAVFTKNTAIGGTIVATMLGPQNAIEVTQKGRAPEDGFHALLASPEGDQPLRVDVMREPAGEALERKPAQPAPAKPMRRMVK
ncbi:MAG: pre-peptidase C-terminal domain-containing protein [Bryobacteraceae bacterium]